MISDDQQHATIFYSRFSIKRPEHYTMDSYLNYPMSHELQNLQGFSDKVSKQDDFHISQKTPVFEWAVQVRKLIPFYCSNRIVQYFFRPASISSLPWLTSWFFQAYLPLYLSPSLSHSRPSLFKIELLVDSSVILFLNMSILKNIQTE